MKRAQAALLSDLDAAFRWQDARQLRNLRGDPLLLQAWADIRNEVYLACLLAIQSSRWRDENREKSVRAFVAKAIRNAWSEFYQAKHDENAFRANPFRSFEEQTGAVRAAIAGHERDREGEATTGWTKAPEIEDAEPTAEHRVTFEWREDPSVSRRTGPCWKRIEDLVTRNDEPVSHDDPLFDKAAVAPLFESEDGRLARAYLYDPLEHCTTDDAAAKFWKALARESSARNLDPRFFVSFFVCRTLLGVGFFRRTDEIPVSRYSLQWGDDPPTTYRQRDYLRSSFLEWVREEVQRKGSPIYGLIKYVTAPSFRSKSLEIIHGPDARIRDNPDYARECAPQGARGLGYHMGRLWKDHRHPSMVYKKHVSQLNEARKIQAQEAAEYPVCVRHGHRVPALFTKTRNGICECWWPKPYLFFLWLRILVKIGEHSLLISRGRLRGENEANFFTHD